MKKVVLVLTTLILISGCASQVEIGIDESIEDNKLEYLQVKDKLNQKTEFTKKEDIPLDISSSIDRINEEEISFRVILDNPKVNLNKVEAMLIHDQLTDSIFPTIGILDDKKSLLVNSEDVHGISLVGYLLTTKNIKELEINLRLYIKYLDDDNKSHEVYYKIEDIKYTDKVTKNKTNKSSTKD